MPLQVTLKPADQFIGDRGLRAEMLRRLIEGPCPIAELLAIDGADLGIIASLLEGLPPVLRRALVVQFRG
jgi:hypothetical protein